ncbi:MAG: PhoH family protein [Candidatus Krumholzibacteria bacterium]|nr:PhoH family protein [Candidatus Krumholzibacteria bacterium]
MKYRKRKRILSFAGIDPVRILGVQDSNLKLVEKHFDHQITVRGDEIILDGDTRMLDELTSVMETMIRIAGSGRVVTEGDVHAILHGRENDSGGIESLDGSVVFYSSVKRRKIVPRSVRQKEYVDAIRDYDVVFGIGPAGTGKTYLAIAMALAALKSGEIEKIYVSRPVVEAGENLGFLPGDLKEKIDPYIRPIFDALTYMVGREKVDKMIDAGVLEIAPLAYMRGRTLDNAFAVLDEAQNSTIMQMKMFLTRLGVNSKAIITGDITQIDLVDPAMSGLVAVRDILEDVEGIKFVTFGGEDVVRHRLVKRIIKAFSALNPGNRETSGPDKRGSRDNTRSDLEENDG